MYSKERFDKNGNLISYRLICSGKDPLTGEHVNYTKTWKIPTGLTGKKEIKFQLDKEKIKFEEECKRKSLGLQAVENNILFENFANEWLERILNRNTDSFSFYSRAKDNLKVIIPFFKNILLKGITPSLIQKFYDYICSRTYTKREVVVKKSINEIIDDQHLIKTKIANELGIARLTLRLASTIGERINKKTAVIICRYFQIPFNKYFEEKVKETKYSKHTNVSIRTTLIMILNSAKRERLIEYNFATKEFTDPIKAPKHKKESYNIDESKLFVQALLKEKDLRKKSIFAFLIFLGLRKSEICGLEWKDIDFQKNKVSIERNSLYISGFGTITKNTKTDNSTRSLDMPQILVDILKEYKLWWDEQKLIHGDLWEFKDKSYCYKDRLYLQECGKPINTSTIGQWLNKFETLNGLRHLTPHELRHTAITMQIYSGISIKDVSRNAGHANETITLEIYAHSLQEMQKENAKKFEDFLLN